MDVILFAAGCTAGALLIFIIFQKKIKAQEKKQMAEIIQKDREISEKNGEIRVLGERVKNQKENQDLLAAKLENVANRIFENSEKKSREQMKLVLDPLNRDISSFRQKIEEMNSGTRDRMTSLSEKIENLQKLNREITEETSNLTKALKGDRKKQGNWGEVILQRLLELSGLRKGVEFDTQVSVTDEGHRRQPDVIINLPEGKHLIIDSKVSLVAYERAVNADNEDDYERHYKDFFISVKKHVNELYEKHYQGLKDVNSPDYVFMFMPVEGSYMMAMSKGFELYEYGIKKQVIIVGPTNLLASLKTVSLIWQQENQTRNAQLIAEKSGAMLDKFIGFYEDLKKIGEQLDRTRTSYDAAVNKLSTGRGNLMNRITEIQDLGARGKKKLE